MEKFFHQTFKEQIREVQECIFHIALHYEALKQKREKDYKEGKLSSLSYEKLKNVSIIECPAFLQNYCLSFKERRFLKKYALLSSDGEICLQLLKNEFLKKSATLDSLFRSILICHAFAMLENEDLKSFGREIAANYFQTLLNKAMQLTKNLPKKEKKEVMCKIANKRKKVMHDLNFCSRSQMKDFIFHLKNVNPVYYDCFLVYCGVKEDSFLTDFIDKKRKEAFITREELDSFFNQIQMYLEFTPFQENINVSKKEYQKKQVVSHVA